MDPGWSKIGAFTYRHYCGAKVAKRGASWSATTQAGISIGSYRTETEAIEHLEKTDKHFWSYGETASGGLLDINGELSVTTGFLDRERKAHVVVFERARSSLSNSLICLFGKHFFRKAVCARCAAPMTEMRIISLREFDGPKSYRGHYIACACDCPAWRIEQGAFSGAEVSLCQTQRNAENSKWRKARLQDNGGKHSRRELREISELQENRCFYCHGLFGKDLPATKDHLLAVAFGGGDWALNIVLACRRCNLRRGTIPFRTYCKVLSPTQNRRILKHLRNRLLALDLDRLPDEAWTSFYLGLLRHNPRHRRYRDLQQNSLKISGYAAKNELLPSSADRILRKTSDQ